jgi:hypothetical protein
VGEVEARQDVAAHTLRQRTSANLGNHQVFVTLQAAQRVDERTQALSCVHVTNLSAAQGLMNPGAFMRPRNHNLPPPGVTSSETPRE